MSCLANAAAGGGAGKGVSAVRQLLGTGVRGCSKSCANSSLGIPGWAGRSGKALFLPKVEAGGLNFLSTMPLGESNERKGKLKHRQERDDN